MEEYHIHLIYIYFIINAGIFGYEVGDDFKCKKEKYWKITLSVTFVLGMCFNILFYFFGYFWRLLKKLWEWINEYFQIYFWWKFYLTDEYDNMDLDRLNVLNAKRHYRYNKDIRPHREYSKCVNAINGKNNFIYLKDEVDTNF